MRFLIVFLIAAALAGAFAGCGSKAGGKCGDLPEPVAVVNGKPISCTDYVRQLNIQAGGQVLMSMIQQAVLDDWAEKEGVAPTEEQIKNQIAKHKEEGMWEDQVKMFGEAGLQYKLRGDQARVNLARKLLKIQDKEVAALYEEMKPQFVHGPRKMVAAIVHIDKAKVDDALKALDKGKKFEDAAEEFSMQTNVKFWVPEEDTTGRLPESVVQAVKDLKVGETSKVVSFDSPMGGQTTYLILKVLKTQGPADKKLKDVKDDLIDTLALRKSMTDSEFQKKLNSRVKAAKMQVNIEQYKDLPKQMEGMASE